MHLEANQGPSNEFGYFLVGTTFTEPGRALSNGPLCVSGQVGRFNVVGSGRNSTGRLNSTGVFENIAGTTNAPSNAGFDVPVTMPVTGSPTINPCSTWSFQTWHRESGGESNFSNGLAVTF